MLIFLLILADPPSWVGASESLSAACLDRTFTTCRERESHDSESMRGPAISSFVERGKLFLSIMLTQRNFHLSNISHRPLDDEWIASGSSSPLPIILVASVCPQIWGRISPSYTLTYYTEMEIEEVVEQAA